MSQTPPTRSERAPLVTDAIPPVLRRRGGTQRQVFTTVLVGALVLALFASRDTPGWAERLGDAPLAHQARTLAAAWDERMELLGLIRPHELLRAAMQRALDWKWGDNSR
jgi:hypothetical protein